MEKEKTERIIIAIENLGNGLVSLADTFKRMVDAQEEAVRI